MEQRFKFRLARVIDGDSLEGDIELGFGVVLQRQKIRLAGVDTPESRTSDLEEKYYGMLAKDFVVRWCAVDNPMWLVVREGEASYDKFGRILADLEYAGSANAAGRLVAAIIAAHHGVVYQGQSKESIQSLHLENRKYFTPFNN
jgi:micrococcal nuclease